MFEVRTLFEVHGDVRGFDVSIELALVEAGRTGRFLELQQELRRWLRIALVGANAEGMAGLDAPARNTWAMGLAADWLAHRPGSWWRPPGVAPGSR